MCVAELTVHVGLQFSMKQQQQQMWYIVSSHAVWVVDGHSVGSCAVSSAASSSGQWSLMWPVAVGASSMWSDADMLLLLRLLRLSLRRSMLCELHGAAEQQWQVYVGARGHRPPKILPSRPPPKKEKICVAPIAIFKLWAETFMPTSMYICTHV